VDDGEEADDAGGYTTAEEMSRVTTTLLFTRALMQ
jgi:hypothetical protein